MKKNILIILGAICLFGYNAHADEQKYTDCPQYKQIDTEARKYLQNCLSNPELTTKECMKATKKMIKKQKKIMKKHHNETEK